MTQMSTRGQSLHCNQSHTLGLSEFGTTSLPVPAQACTLSYNRAVVLHLLLSNPKWDQSRRNVKVNFDFYSFRAATTHGLANSETLAWHKAAHGKISLNFVVSLFLFGKKNQTTTTVEAIESPIQVVVGALCAPSDCLSECLIRKKNKLATIEMKPMHSGKQ